MKVGDVTKEAARILRDNPWLTHKRALEIAKKMHKENPQDCSPAGANEINSNNYNTD